ncbi:MAG TPA: hypothetical protein VFZ66_23475 [Herpetosiphonaceae bacterium]
MSNSMDSDLARLFATYEAAFSALDVEAAIGVFAECCMAAAPHFVGCTTSEDELRAAVTQIYEFYRRVELESVRILALSETALDDHYALVKVKWAAFFRKTGDEPIAFEVTYVVSRDAEQPKVILFIAHQDEQTIMRDKGLLPA